MLVFISEFPFWLNIVLSWGLGILIYIIFVFLICGIINEFISEDLADFSIYITFFGWIIEPVAMIYHDLFHPTVSRYFNKMINYFETKSIRDFKKAAQYEEEMDLLHWR